MAVWKSKMPPLRAIIAFLSFFYLKISQFNWLFKSVGCGWINCFEEDNFILTLVISCNIPPFGGTSYSHDKTNAFLANLLFIVYYVFHVVIFKWLLLHIFFLLIIYFYFEVLFWVKFCVQNLSNSFPCTIKAKH